MSSNYPYIFGPKKENSIEKTISAERLKEIREQIDQYRRQNSKSSKPADTAFDNSINQQSSNRKERHHLDAVSDPYGYQGAREAQEAAE